MKYCVVIIDGAAGLPIPERGGKTSLELARTPNLDSLAKEGFCGLARTIPPGMEPSSANACMSILGYDPSRYHLGRAAIEARSMGIFIEKGEAVFRANLVSVKDGRMLDYSGGHIPNNEANILITNLNEGLGNEHVHFYPGVSYRNICKIKSREDTLKAECTPPHDIPGKQIRDFLPRGPGSGLLLELMQNSVALLENHSVNLEREARGEAPANMLWLFWGSGRVTSLPNFKKLYGMPATVTSAVDILRGLALLMGMGLLEIPGVKDGLDNDFHAQAQGALQSLTEHDMAVIHIEATDEAGHTGSIDDKVLAIERVDSEVIAQIRKFQDNSLRVLVMPDHATPIVTRTHSPEPVPFLLWGDGFVANGGERLTEAEAKATGFFVADGYSIMRRLVG